MNKIYFTILFYLAGASVYCQNITGVVMDSITGKAIINASLFLTLKDSSRVLSFTFTGSDGKFSIKSTGSKAPVILNIRHLGYYPYSVLIQQENKKSLKILLKPQDKPLPEIEIVSEKPAIIQKKDTVSFDVKQFSDSTEYNVEELLSKLPGIEIENNGIIKYQGRAIDRVLIESTDLFGKKYNIGTRNIRADYIEEVEIINHYQKNPIFKNINLSDKIAINLLLKENKKNIFTGSIDASGGIALDEKLKYALRTNSFLISKKNKHILLTENSNSIYYFSPQEIDLIYGTRDFIGNFSLGNKPFEFLESTNTVNPGVPSVFVNNADKTFVTYRSDFKIFKNWNLSNFNTIGLYKDDQWFHTSLFYIYGLYKLDRYNQSKLKNFHGDTEVKLSYINPYKTMSYEVLVKYMKKTETGIQNVEITANDSSSINYEEYNGKELDNFRVESILNKKIKNNKVFQFKYAYNYFQQPLKLESYNDYLPVYFDADSTFMFVKQDINYDFDGNSFKLDYIAKENRWILKTGLYFDIKNYKFNNRPLLYNQSGAAINVFSSGNRTNDEKIVDRGLNIFLKYDLSDNISLKIKSNIFKSKITTRLNTPLYDGDNFSGDIKMHINYIASQKSSMSFLYLYVNKLPSAVDFFRIPYFSSGSTYILPDEYTKNTKYHKFVFLLKNFDKWTFRSYSLKLNLLYHQQYKDNYYKFFGSFNALHPYYASNKFKMQLAIAYDKFFPHIKTDITVKNSFSFKNYYYFLNDQLKKMDAINSKFTLKINKLFDNRLKISLLTGLNYFALKYSTNPFEIVNINNVLKIEKINKIWQYKVEMYYNFDASNSSNNYFLGMNGSISKNIVFNKRKVKAYLNIINLLNTKNITRTYKSNAFINNFVVEEVPMYILLGADFSL